MRACMQGTIHWHLGHLLPVAVQQAARAPVQRALGALGLDLDRLLPALPWQHVPWSAVPVLM